MSNKRIKRTRGSWIPIVMTLAFILGFFLIQGGITGLVTLEPATDTVTFEVNSIISATATLELISGTQIQQILLSELTDIQPILENDTLVAYNITNITIDLVKHNIEPAENITIRFVEIYKEITKEFEIINITPIENIILPQNITEELANTTIPEIPENITEALVNITPILENITEEILPAITENITQNITENRTTILQLEAEINKPVTWVKQIQLTKPATNLEIQIPHNAKLIEIKDLETNLIIDDKVEYKFRYFEITNQTITLNDTVQQVQVQYETPAPAITEINISDYKKQITVSSETHYTNITAYTTIKESRRELIKLYRTTDGIREEVDITGFIDTNSNSLIDKVSWIVPSLSNQTYELIIEISKAEHLDFNRTFISDIYEQVKARDNIWSESINNNEYVRVTFNKDLTKERDITIYARSSLTSRIEVYEKDKNELIADFGVISEDKKYQILLTNLNNSQDTFDLKVVGNPVEFDYIIDPKTETTLVGNNEAHDISFAVLNDSTGEFVVAWCDDTADAAYYQIDYTNGSQEVATKTIDTGAGDSCRIAATALNGTTFVIAYIDYVVNSADWNVTGYSVNGGTVKDQFSPALISSDMNSLVDISVCALNSTTYVTTVIDDTTNDAEYAIYYRATAKKAVTSLDAEVLPDINDQDIIDCAAFNRSTWAYVYQDDSPDNITYGILTDSGAVKKAATPIDLNTGTNVGMGMAALANGGFVIAFCEATTTDLSFQTFWANGSTESNIIDVDNKAIGCTGASGTHVDVTALKTDDAQFVIIYDQITDNNVTIATYDFAGNQELPPTMIESASDPAEKTAAIESYNVITGQKLCRYNSQNVFLVGYNDLVSAVWGTYYANGSVWDGICEPLKVQLLFPKNSSTSSSHSVSFTYNVSDPGNIVSNCSLYIKHSYAGAWQRNNTDMSISKNINQSINRTLLYENIYWKIGCYDTLTNQINSSTFNFTVSSTPNVLPKINISLPKNSTSSYSHSVSFTYNVTDSDGAIQNCSLYIKHSYAGTWERNATDTSITETINQSINRTLLHENVYWKVGCIDDSLEEANSSTFNYTVRSTTPNVNLITPSNSTQRYSHLANFTYNVSDLDPENKISNCSLFIKHSYAGTWERNKTIGGNMSDGIKTSVLGSDTPGGLTSNGSDFWIVDQTDSFVYHVKRDGTNASDGFKILPIGSDLPQYLTTNGSDFWIVDFTDKFVYHVKRDGTNVSDGFKTSTIGANFPMGITTNGSDFWITDYTDDFVYHVKRNGANVSDGFKTNTFSGFSTPRGIVTNGSDFWITHREPGIEYKIWHTKRDGTLVSSDTINTYNFGSETPAGITISEFTIINDGGNLRNTGGKPYDIWFTDGDKFIYHIKTEIQQNRDQSINITLGHENVNWKIGCYNDFKVQGNSSTFDYTVRPEIKVNLSFPKNNTQSSASKINFTFNVSTTEETIDNCTLWLNINGAGYEANETTKLSSFQNMTGGIDNKTNGVDLTSMCHLGNCISNPRGLTTNGSDFWIGDATTKIIYHLNRDFLVQSDSITDTTFAGVAVNLLVTGIATNGSDLWVMEYYDRYVYHLAKKAGVWTNLSDGFKYDTKTGDLLVYGITSNGTDLWLVSEGDTCVYHMAKKAGVWTNISDGFKLAQSMGATPQPRGITTNGSDFWIVDYTSTYSSDNWVYHVKRTGANVTDGFDYVPLAGSTTEGAMGGITARTTYVNSVLQPFTPKEFWISDYDDKWLYYAKKVILQGINQTFNKSFAPGSHDILWKVGCYDDSASQGNSTTFNLSLTVAAANTAPTICCRRASTLSSQTINLDSWKSMSVTFNVTDADGTDNLKAFANFTGTGDDDGTNTYTDYNISCVYTGKSNATSKEFNCSTKIWYWYKPGYWNISVNATDSELWTNYKNLSEINLALTKAITISPSSLSWPTVNLRDWNKTASNDPIIINNTGNYNVSISKVNVTAYDLHGEAAGYESQEIPAANFTVDIDTGGASCSGASCVECDGTAMANKTSTNIVSSILPVGNRSLADGKTATENISFCLVNVPFSNMISPGISYSTAETAQWIIGIS